MKKRKTREELEIELEATQLRLEEAEETLRAIRNNEVDALIIDGPQGQQVFTLQGAEQPYRTLMETMSEGALTVAADGTILYCNQRFAEMLRAPLNRVIGLPIYEIMPSEESRIFEALFDACGIEGFRGEYRLTTFEGREIPVYTSVRPLFFQDVKSFCIVATDMTEKHALELQLRQAQKLESLGTLAGGIAHDFNNILAIIIGFVELVHESVVPDSLEYTRLGLVLKGAQRGRDIVKQILAFSCQIEQDRKPVSLNNTVEEGLQLLRPMLPSTIKIVSKSIIGDDIILADPGQIQQILINLTTNAIHAMGNKSGILDISISKTGITEKNPAPFIDMPPGEYLILKVCDTGCGMEPKRLERIFDPFFTTKGPGEGTGLGLSVVHGIIESHGGYITVESEPGQGTIFHVYLPKIEGQPVLEDKEIHTMTGNNERVLIVDDEEMLIELNTQRLRRLGYEVVATTSSLRALDLFRKEPDKFDLVITDHTMPDLTGMDLAVELLKVRATIPIILCTGHNKAVSLERAEAAGIKAFLMKPLAKQELARTIRQVLDKKIQE
jgi:two-component system cell cycle sensor histidine kinase/response regulator CckA